MYGTGVPLIIKLDEDSQLEMFSFLLFAGHSPVSKSVVSHL